MLCVNVTNKPANKTAPALTSLIVPIFLSIEVALINPKNTILKNKNFLIN